MKNLSTSFLVVGVVLAVGLGCSRLLRPGAMDLFEGDNAAKAADMIRDKVGTGDVRVIRAEIRKDEMEITIQSPSNPKNIDKYTYEKGSVTGPEPVQVIRMGNIEMNGEKYQTVDLKEIGWAALDETIKRATSISKIENAEVELVSMAFEHPSHTAPKDDPRARRPLGEVDLVFTWRLFVQGPRGREDYWADKSGKLNEKAF